MAASAAVNRASSLTTGWRRWNGAARLHGVDLARALAVFGMLAAHLLTIDDPLALSQPETWIALVNGRPSVLFALLAGVSLAIISGGANPARGAALSLVRRRIAVRALVLWLIGLALLATGVPIYVILPAYAILFLLAIPFLVAPPVVLWVTAAVIAIAVPWILPILDAAPVWESAVGEPLFHATGWPYPFPAWLAYVLAGIAIGRLDLRRTFVAWMLLAAGAAAVAVAGIAATLLRFPEDGYLAAVWSAEPHTEGILDIVGTAGFAAAVLGACLLVCRTPATWVLAPLRAVGSMPLTAYVGQVVAWAIAAFVLLGDTTDLWGFRALEPFWWFIAATVVGCSLWAWLVGRGPVERLVAAVVRWVTPGSAQGRADAADRVDR
ncbi:heparan-alpha-glucosaminide N-acetyltransferase domain-containing protein [Microbacterium dauci]|uniref:Heparan-alpha-glucosaminide N-acetyltransferase domain-containing protein n=1 Tax=Microbacterium dauci TaxID=3048008 RepID=A0ABT6ZFY9_9MICO|nr:heparan-alpha-glucosaminide N-acetyltransferase domain-containing protein [Microbacterium sp. LX3-4]MDJ1115064.1 heparan-alpha-glucosaminide N-acetyltransferase domain-containing protein [Microbacterium sp. LX3-4]